MAAVSNLSTKGSAVLADGATYEGRVLASGGTLRVLAPRSVELFAAPYTGIERTTRSTWTVTLADGATVAIESAGCGCSKSR